MLPTVYYLDTHMAPKKQTRKRIPLLVITLVLCVVYVIYAAARPLPTLQATAVTIPAVQPKMVSLAWPSYGEAAVGAAGQNVLAVHGNEKPLPTASIAKIITALAVLKQKPLTLHASGPIIALTQADVDLYNKYVAMDGSVVPVQAGEKISEYQALQALLLPSGNNIAETLVRWAFGSVDAYNTYANKYVRELGMTNTTITDPSGFLPTTVSTPRDLTILGEAAMNDPVVADIVGQSTATLPVAGVVHNYNSLLGQGGIVGIKTGNSDQDLGAFLFAANKTVGSHNVIVLGAVMDAPDLGTALRDSLQLSGSTASAFHEVTLVNTNDVFGTYSVPWQGKVDVIAKTSLSLAAWDDSTTTTSTTIQKLSMPSTKGTDVGRLRVQNSASSATQTIQLVLRQSIEQPNIFWRLAHPF